MHQHYEQVKCSSSTNTLQELQLQSALSGNHIIKSTHTKSTIKARLARFSAIFNNQQLTGGLLPTFWLN